MEDPFGWRAKVGVLLPSVNTVAEPWFYRVAPPGVTFHFARMMVGQGSGVEAVKKMMEDSLRAAQEVASIPVDVIAYCCTASTLIMGPDYDKELISKLESETRIPVTTATASLSAAFQALKVRTLSLISPYTQEIEAFEVKYFSECGYEILSARSMNLGIHELDKPSPDEIYRFAKKGFEQKADCMLISCLNFRSQACIKTLENDIQKPVVTSAQAVLWNVLRMVNVKEPIVGYGKLLDAERI